MRYYLLDWRQAPIGMTRYYWYRTIGATVCRVAGHRQDEACILIGTCFRCWGHLPNANSNAAWAEALRLRDEREGRS